MIKTQQSRIPWFWVILATATTAVSSLVENLSGAPLTFTLRKFTDQPSLIAWVSVINIAFNVMVAPYTAWKSDRIWTRLGRRRPFFVVGWSLLAAALVLVPFAPNLTVLALVVFIWQFGQDFGYSGPWSPLFYEIVPPAQRGRAVVIKRGMSVLMGLFFTMVLLRQYDQKYPIPLPGNGTFTLTGEMVLYLTTAVLVIAALTNLLLNVEETPPKTRVPAERFTPFNFLRDLFAERQFLLIYLLLFCSVGMTASLGNLGALLITDQWGYSKADFADMGTWSITLNLAVVVPVGFLITDRFNRFRLFQVGLLLSTLHPLGYWLFVKYWADGQPPGVAWIIGWGLANSLVDALASLALEPYFFDLMPRSKMGTMNSGFLLVSAVLRIPMMVGVAYWVEWSTKWFGPPATWHARNAQPQNYMSGFLFVFAMGVLACAAALYFDYERRRGRVIEYGKLEAQGVDVEALARQRKQASKKEEPATETMA